MSATASSLSFRSAQSLSTRTARSVPAQANGVNWGRYALRGLGTVVAAVLANPGGAIFFTVVPAIVAVLLYAGLARFSSHAARIFTVISAIVFVVTLIPDFTYIPTVPGSSNEQTAILVLMHVIAAAVIVRLLTSTPARQT